MTDGQLLVGQTGADPLPKTLTGDITIHYAGGTAIGASKVSQAKLKTSTGAVSVSRTVEGSTSTLLTLPGGEYGFYPQTTIAKGDTNGSRTATGTAIIHTRAVTAQTSASYATNILLTINNSAGMDAASYMYAQQRYVTSSGEVFWIFFLRDKITKNVIASYQAPDHPCMGNGGKPLLVPHPFNDYDPEKHEIVVITPSEEELAAIRKACDSGDEETPDRDILRVITEDYDIDEKSEPEWPTKAVTVGLPREVEVEGEMVPVQSAPIGTSVTPIKKVIPKPEGVLLKSIIKKKDLSYFEPYRMAA
jgi:hypothetical protein